MRKYTIRKLASEIRQLRERDMRDFHKLRERDRKDFQKFKGQLRRALARKKDK